MTDLKMGSSWSQIFTPEQIRDAAMQRFNELAPAKYDKGQEEHGGIIVERDLIEELEKEVADLWFYLQALKLKLAKLKAIHENNRPV